MTRHLHPALSVAIFENGLVEAQIGVSSRMMQWPTSNTRSPG